MNAKKKSDLPGEENNFEQAMEKLEKIVADLDEGNLSLEKSLNSFEDGMKLARFCEQKLDEASGRVEKIMKDFSGQIKTVEFKDAADAGNGE